MSISICLSAQSVNPEKVVEKNLKAYNKRDINGFMASFTPDIALYNLGDSKPSISGFDAIKSFYKKVFDASPKLRSTILKRIVYDNKVIDHERIVGRVGARKPIEIVLIYEIKGNKIAKLTAIRK
jgi:hypothetical protein